MARTQWDVVRQQVHSLAALHADVPTEDAELLGQFVARCDEVAFEALLRRHGPMVLRVARRILHSEVDAEDVFQATFLLLARKAGSIRRRHSVASWLHGVAHRLALHARAERVRRRVKEIQAAEARVEAAWTELDGVLDDVLAQLPEKYRTPLVSCYLEGRTQEEVAQLLGAPLGTVRSWLTRGRELLRKRLVRRGVLLSTAGVNSAMLANAAGARTPVPTPLLRTTLQAALPFAAGQGTHTAVSARIATLVRQGLTTLVLARVKTTTAWLLVLALLSGTVLLARQALTAKPPNANTEPPVAAAPEAERGGEKARTDLYGDPLPAGAVARLGTAHFRHEGWLEDFALSPDGRTMAAVAGTGLSIWDAATGQPVRRFRFTGDVYCLAFAPDGKAVAVGGEDCIVRLLDLASGKEVRRFVGHEPGKEHFHRGISKVSFTGDGATLLTAGSDGTKRLWEVSSGKELRQLDKDWLIAGLSPDGKLLAYEETESKTVLRLWDLAAGKEVRQLKHPEKVGRVAFSPDGKLLAVAYGAEDRPEKILLWDLEGKERGTLAGHESWIFALAFAPDSRTLASGGYDKTTRLWNCGSLQELQKPQHLGTPVYHLAFSRDGKTLFTQGAENQVRPWDVATWRERPPGEGPAHSIGWLAYTPDGKRVAVASASRVWFWDAVTGKLLKSLDNEADFLSAGALSADGKVLVSQSLNGVLRVWGPESGKERRRIETGVNANERLAVSPDGAIVAAWNMDRDKAISLWDTATGKELRTLEVPSEGGARASIDVLCFTHDGRALYAASGTHLVVLRWDVATGKPLPSVGKHDGGLNALALSPDDRSLAVVTMDGTLFLWELATGQTRLVLKDPGYATSVAFSPDGRLLALANAGTHRLKRGTEVIHEGIENLEEVRLVSVADGKVVRRFTGHTGGISCLSFSPDGRTLASGGQDTTVLLWEVPERSAYGPKDVPPVEAAALARLWDGLGEDADQAHVRMAQLIANPAQALPLLRERLKPVAVANPERVAALLKKLDSDQFDEREEATRELKKLGDAAESVLRQALKEKLAPETRRRVEEIVDGLSGVSASGERLRVLRALEVLERLGDSDARDLLRRLSAGAEGAWLTEEARATLRRVERLGKAGR